MNALMRDDLIPIDENPVRDAACSSAVERAEIVRFTMRSSGDYPFPWDGAILMRCPSTMKQS